MSHVHGHPTRSGARYRRRLTWVLALVLAFMVVEVVVGVLADSLALLSDAGHMATDGLGLGMALAAIVVADRADRLGHRTYGLYRLEILAALANAVVLFGVAGYVLWEAVRRIQDPPDVAGGPMLAAALAGLAVNLVGWWLLREGAEESINVEGAYLEVVADLLGSVAVVIAAVVVGLTGWSVVDPLIGAGVGLFILPRAWRLGGRAVRILVQAAPRGLDVAEVQERLGDIPGVGDVHDLHVWTLTSDMDVASVHLMTVGGADPHSVLDRARILLRDDYGIAHATLQVEPDTHQGCSEITW